MVRHLWSHCYSAAHPTRRVLQGRGSSWLPPAPCRAHDRREIGGPTHGQTVSRPAPDGHRPEARTSGKTKGPCVDLTCSVYPTISARPVYERSSQRSGARRARHRRASSTVGGRLGDPKRRLGACVSVVAECHPKSRFSGVGETITKQPQELSALRDIASAAVGGM